MITEIISVELFSLLVLVIVLYGNICETREHNKKRQIFSIIIVVQFIATLADSISWILDNKPKQVISAYITTYLATVLCFIISALYIYYIYLHISEKANVDFGPFKRMIIYNIVCTIVTSIACMNGMLFKFVDGVYVEQPFYVIYLIANSISLLYGAIVCIRFIKELGKHDFIATVSWILIPTLSIVVNIIVPGFSMTYPAITLAIMIVYVMLQSDHEKNLINSNNDILQQLTYDPLTKLRSRVAYNNVVEYFASRDNLIGVVFCDLNNLKHANDNYGHEKGDKLLCDFASILQTYFREEEIYRVGGDEFIILMPNISNELIEQRISSVKSHRNEFGNIVASLGYAVGNSKDIHTLIKTAEQNMYDDKYAFYKKQI